ncbi:transcriptional regulator, TetR family [Lachnospiraceae bacterium KM106-2]|nr:transcriptional regulator, TetR family [Lachnospiraceae bacterium KM106-2]
MQHRNTDLRIQRTRNAIKTAFQDMICEMEANEITVAELTRRAQIHRKTFYLHYTSIEALFEDMLSELAENYYAMWDQLEPPFSFLEVNRVFFEFCAKNTMYQERLMCDPSYRDFCNKLFTTTLQHNRDHYNPYAHCSERVQRIINKFLTTNSLEFYRDWVAAGKDLPLEELIDITGTLLNDAISSFVEPEYYL